MSLSKHLEEAVRRLEEARRRITAAQERPRSIESLGEWIAGLTEFSFALAEVHEYTNESVQEGLQELAARVRAVPGRAGAAPPGEG